MRGRGALLHFQYLALDLIARADSHGVPSMRLVARPPRERMIHQFRELPVRELPFRKRIPDAKTRLRRVSGRRQDSERGRALQSRQINHFEKWEPVKIGIARTKFACGSDIGGDIRHRLLCHRRDTRDGLPGDHLR